MKPLLWDAINPYTGTPFTWDDQNIRWGDPSVYLEENDPGFVPYPGMTLPDLTPVKPKRKHTMPKSAHIKGSDAAFAAQLKTFKNNIGDHATTLGLTPAEVTAQANDCDYFNYVLDCQDACSKCSQQWTAWKDIIRDGGAPPATGGPAEAPMPTPVAAVAPGVEKRFRDLVKRIKAHPAYNPAIGEALGIEGDEQSGPDFATFKPEYDVVFLGGVVVVRWTWQGQSAFLRGIEIQVDRGDGQGFRLLTVDTTPGYNDTHPLPATPTVWKYRAIFQGKDDQRVGQWSDEKTITVGG